MPIIPYRRCWIFPVLFNYPLDQCYRTTNRRTIRCGVLPQCDDDGDEAPIYGHHWPQLAAGQSSYCIKPNILVWYPYFLPYSRLGFK